MEDGQLASRVWRADAFRSYTLARLFRGAPDGVPLVASTSLVGITDSSLFRDY